MLLFPAAALGYGVGILLATMHLLRRGEAARRAASVALLLGWACHLAALARHVALTGFLPLSNLGEFLLTLGWVVASLHLYLWFRLRVDVAGLVLPPIAAICILAAWRLLPGGGVQAAEVPRGGWFLFHTAVSTLGLAILAVAFTMSLIYVLQDRALKSKRPPGRIAGLPALEKSDHIGFHALVLGFVLLTLGIGTGVVINADVHDRLWILGPKQLFPVLAWIVFATILVARAALGFRGRKSAYITIAGFALGLLCVLGMTL